MPLDWRALREQCVALDAETVLVTPSSERPFVIERSDDDRIEIRYRDTDESRPLWRTQFQVLADRVDATPDGVPTADLAPGVEPYVAVLSLHPGFVADADEGVLRQAREEEDEPTADSPYLRPEWEARATPERVRDDALLLADALEEFGAEGGAGLGGEMLADDALADLYVLLSDVQRGADRLRRSIGDAVLTRTGPDGRIHGRFGTVHRTTRERRSLKDEETVFRALDEHDVPHEWVLGVDTEKLDVVLAATDVEEDDVYDVSQQVYAQKTEVEEGEKQERLHGLRDRLDALDDPAADDLRDDIASLEARLDALLAAG